MHQTIHINYAIKRNIFVFLISTRNMKTGLLALFILFIYCGCSRNNESADNELVIFCASSLTDVISDITAGFERDNHIQVKLNFASSGTLARQIEQGANPDIFISANKNWLNYLNQKALTLPGTEEKLAGNSMVLVAPLKSPLDSVSFSARLNLPEMISGRISIGDPKHVPAGVYALQIITSLGWKHELEPRFLPAKDVRSALMVVEMGEIDAGIVYKTDALKSKKVKIITEFPDSLHEPVNYYITIIKGRDNLNNRKLYTYLLSEKSGSIWEKYGFIYK